MIQHIAIIGLYAAMAGFVICIFIGLLSLLI
jgi:hypothetical protein